MRKLIQINRKGFTLIELLIAMVIALVVITSLASAFIYQRKTYDVQEQVTGMIQSARAAMDMISREIYMAGYDPTAALTLGTSVGIIYDSDNLRILADLDGNGDASGPNEDITYSYDSNQIERNTGSGGQPFAENIESFSFLYYDEDGNGTTDSSKIRQVKITIEAKTSKPDPNYTNPDHTDGYRRYKIKSHITPPNLAT